MELCLQLEELLEEKRGKEKLFSAPLVLSSRKAQQVQNWSKAILRRGFNQGTCHRCLDVIPYSHHSFFSKSLLWMIQIWGKEAGEHIKRLQMSINLLLKLQILPATPTTSIDCNKIYDWEWIIISLGMLLFLF